MRRLTAVLSSVSLVRTAGFLFLTIFTSASSRAQLWGNYQRQRDELRGLEALNGASYRNVLHLYNELKSTRDPKETVRFTYAIKVELIQIFTSWKEELKRWGNASGIEFVKIATDPGLSKWRSILFDVDSETKARERYSRLRQMYMGDGIRTAVDEIAEELRHDITLLSAGPAAENDRLAGAMDRALKAWSVVPYDEHLRGLRGNQSPERRGGSTLDGLDPNDSGLGAPYPWEEAGSPASVAPTQIPDDPALPAVSTAATWKLHALMGSDARPQVVMSVPGRSHPWIGVPGDAVSGSSYRLGQVDLSGSAAWVELESDDSGSQPLRLYRDGRVVAAASRPSAVVPKQTGRTPGGSQPAGPLQGKTATAGAAASSLPGVKQLRTGSGVIRYAGKVEFGGVPHARLEQEIDGMEIGLLHKAGDLVPGTDYRIVEISSDSVLLESTKGSPSVRLKSTGG